MVTLAKAQKENQTKEKGEKVSNSIELFSVTLLEDKKIMFGNRDLKK